MFFGYWLFHIIEQQLCEQKYTVHNFRKDIPNMFNININQSINSQETSSLSLFHPFFHLSSSLSSFSYHLSSSLYLSILLPPSLSFSSLASFFSLSLFFPTSLSSTPSFFLPPPLCFFYYICNHVFNCYYSYPLF